ncbi:hypothetical protein D1007_40086 [Hordeum vulgare]|nr:hypothetical protein D1007_40086 [Hordeum vulgare]
MGGNDDGGQNSSNMDPRHGSSDKARWEAAAMETQGGGRGSEKWGDNNNNAVAGGAAGGRHPTPGKRNASPLVGGVESRVTSTKIMDVIPTPPAIEEVQTRFSKRTSGINMEHVGNGAEKMAKKRKLQGNEILPGNSFDVLSNMEIISSIMQMGVNIPDDNFAVIDVIRELEKSRANIAKKINNNEK